MGFSTIIDILGSTLVGGFLMLILFRLTDATSENTFMYGGELNTQQNLVAVVDLLEYDFKRIGYCEEANNVPAAAEVIVEATDKSITFLTDLAISETNPRGDGIVDTLVYELGPEITSTPNPNDKSLFRYKKGAKKFSANLGITDLKFTYYDVFRQEITDMSLVSDISLIQIDIRIEDVYGYDIENDEKTHEEKFATVLWRQIRLPAKRRNRWGYNNGW